MVLKELLKDINILETDADLSMEIGGVSYDSRQTLPGDLFVAVRGLETDGHKYIGKAAENGAAAVICEEKPEADLPYILVENSRKCLALVSCTWFDYPSDGMCVIGVTGTSGKTTSTHLIKHILEDRLDAKVGLVGTNGNMIGDEMLHAERTTPESFELQKLFAEMRDAGCTHVVMEVSSHSLVLDRVLGTDFDIGAYTNLSQDHLDFHTDMDDYANAKRMLFDMCSYACINTDDAYAPVMLRDNTCDIITYGIESSGAMMRAEDIKLTARDVEFRLVYDNEVNIIKLGIPGMFSVYNAMTAISCCAAAGVCVAESAEALLTSKVVNGRMESVPTDGDYTVLIDYSHKPDALEKALKTLRRVTDGRVVCMFGCGGDRDRLKRPIMGRVAAENSDFVVVTSDNPRTEEPLAIIDEILPGFEGHDTPYKVIPDRIEAIHWCIDNAESGDVILLAGKGHEDYQIIGHEKHHMDEHEIVADYLKERAQR